MIKAGICGFGGLGHVHANSLWQLEGVKVAAVCDINPEQLARKEVAFNIEQNANQFDISGSRTYTDFKEMLAKEDLDMLVIALPSDLHSPYSVMAMESGCHVFSEKPMSLDIESCNKMIAARDATGRKLMIGQCIRFWPEYEFLFDAIKSGRYGKLRSLIMERLGYHSLKDPNNWFNQPERAGGALLDLHVHDVDWVQSTLGTPKRINASGVMRENGGLDDSTSIWNYDGMYATIRASWMYTNPFLMAFKAVFDDATVEYSSRSTPTLTVTSAENLKREAVEVAKESAYVREMRYFLECIRGERKNTRCTAESSRESIRLALLEKEAILAGI